jgi:hypothetical protein
MGRYCKAYPARRFRAYDGWLEDCSHLRATAGGEKRTRIADEDVLYLQENYVVTDGIYMDENVVFSDVTDGWKRFCAGALGFVLPDYARAPEDAAPSAGERR